MLGRLGSGLLSRALGRSIIAAGGFNGRVRDGIGWKAPAWAAKPAKHTFWVANRLTPASRYWLRTGSRLRRGVMNNLVLELDLVLRSSS